jgi:hypothetical protein
MPRFSELLKPELAKDPEEVQFHSVRSRAIGAYGGLEQTLCELYFNLSGGAGSVSPPDWQKGKAQAAEQFFKMFRSNERHSKLEALLQAKCGNTYSVFWNSLRTQLEATAKRRNEIVHWHIAKVIGDHETHHQLMSPNYWAISPTTPFITVDALWDFFDRCGALSQFCNSLNLLVSDEHLKLLENNPDIINVYKGICQKEVVYPIPDTHFLSTGTIPSTATAATPS